jgi:hypothetical protein
MALPPFLPAGYCSKTVVLPDYLGNIGGCGIRLPPVSLPPATPVRFHQPFLWIKCDLKSLLERHSDLVSAKARPSASGPGNQQPGPHYSGHRSRGRRAAASFSAARSAPIDRAAYTTGTRSKPSIVKARPIAPTLSSMPSARNRSRTAPWAPTMRSAMPRLVSVACNSCSMREPARSR